MWNRFATLGAFYIISEHPRFYTSWSSISCYLYLLQNSNFCKSPFIQKCTCVAQMHNALRKVNRKVINSQKKKSGQIAKHILISEKEFFILDDIVIVALLFANCSSASSPYYCQLIIGILRQNLASNTRQPMVMNSEHRRRILEGWLSLLLRG